jgi:hypothetical protein
MLRQLAWASFVSVSAVLVSVLPVTAKSPDHTCYIKTRNNQIIDLTRSVCGFDAQQSAKDAKQDAAFLADAAKFMQNSGAPAEYQQIFQNNPGLFVSEARNYCQARLSGMTDNQIMEQKYRQISESSRNSSGGYSRQMEISMMAAGLASQIAPKHYCPKIARA